MPHSNQTKNQPAESKPHWRPARHVRGCHWQREQYDYDEQQLANYRQYISTFRKSILILGVLLLPSLLCAQAEQTLRNLVLDLEKIHVDGGNTDLYNPDLILTKYFTDEFYGQLFGRAESGSGIIPSTNTPKKFCLDFITLYHLKYPGLHYTEFVCTSGFEIITRISTTLEVVPPRLDRGSEYRLMIDMVATPAGYRIIHIGSPETIRQQFPCDQSGPPPDIPPPYACDTTWKKSVRDLRQDTTRLHAAIDRKTDTIYLYRNRVDSFRIVLRDTVRVLDSTRQYLAVTQDTLSCYKNIFAIQQETRRTKGKLVEELDKQFANILEWIEDKRQFGTFVPPENFRSWLLSGEVLDSILPIYTVYKELAQTPIVVECIPGEPIEYELDLLSSSSYVNLSYLLFHNLGNIIDALPGENLCSQMNQYNEDFLVSVGRSHRSENTSKNVAFEKIIDILPCVGYRILRERKCLGSLRDDSDIGAGVAKVKELYDKKDYTNALLTYFTISHLLELKDVDPVVAAEAKFALGQILMWDLDEVSSTLRGVPPCALKLIGYDWNRFTLQLQRYHGEQLLVGTMTNVSLPANLRILARRSLEQMDR